MTHPDPDHCADETPVTIGFGIITSPVPLPQIPNSPKGRKTGKELERAVRFIQQTILESDPNLKGAEFSIECRKIFEIAGVRHEFDVFVTTLLDSPYQATWAFECKDWKKPVGKNDIIVLAEKVHAIGANRGYMVARKITKDAANQIQQDNRLSFVPVTDDFLAPFRDIQLIQVSYDLLPARISVKERGSSGKLKGLDWTACKCRFHGKTMSLFELTKPHVGKLIFQQDPTTQPKQLEVGIHSDRRRTAVAFPEGALDVNGVPVERIGIDIQFFMRVQLHKLLSKFELRDRGRCFSFAPIWNSTRWQAPRN